jgi:type II secretory pathway component PulF
VDASLGPVALLLLLIPAIALRIAIRVLYGRRSLGSADPMHSLLSLASTIMVVLAVLGLCAGLWVLVIPLSIAAAIVLVMMVDRSRRLEHRALLGALAAAADRQIPLSESARAYADETLGDTGVRAIALAEAIERGQPLSGAVQTARLRMGTATRMAIRLGERLGLLGTAMRQQLDDSQQVDATLRDVIGRFFYLGNVVIVLYVVNIFVMLKIVPVLQRMFQEFGLNLPRMTKLVINFSNWYVEFGWWMTAPMIILAVLFLVAGLLYYVGWVPRDLPLLWFLFRHYDGALVMRGLSLAVRRGSPMPQAMRLVADGYPVSIVAGRLRWAADRASSGVHWCESLRQAGLVGRASAAVLSAAERVGNLEWALEEMADSTIRRQIYWVKASLQVLFPAAVLAVGSVVAVFVVGLFVPLISLINGLT